MDLWLLPGSGLHLPPTPASPSWSASSPDPTSNGGPSLRQTPNVHSTCGVKADPTRASCPLRLELPSTTGQADLHGAPERRPVESLPLGVGCPASTGEGISRCNYSSRKKRFTLARWGWGGGTFPRGSGGQREVRGTFSRWPRRSQAPRCGEDHMPWSTAGTGRRGPAATRIRALPHSPSLGEPPHFLAGLSLPLLTALLGSERSPSTPFAGPWLHAWQTRCPAVS